MAKLSDFIHSSKIFRREKLKVITWRSCYFARVCMDNNASWKKNELVKKARISCGVNNF